MMSKGGSMMPAQMTVKQFLKFYMDSVEGSLEFYYPGYKDSDQTHHIEDMIVNTSVITEAMVKLIEAIPWVNNS
jgi:hypothetical protein